MSKRSKIIYWIATIWLSLGMVSTGAVQIFKGKTGAGGLDSLTHLGYPEYILTFIGICKILGVIVILLPKYPIIKEWAYSGFFFLMAGALFSHLSVGIDNQIIPVLLLLFLMLISWYFRPARMKLSLDRTADRPITTATQ